jgi:hypothetical protein
MFKNLSIIQKPNNMQILSNVESEKQVAAFLNLLRSSASSFYLTVEFFQLTLQEPHFERLNCAYIQNANKTQGLLYEAVTNRFFFVKTDKAGSPVLSGLTKSVERLIPRRLKDKMLWVCANKTDKPIDKEDFTASFTLTRGHK